MCLMSTSAEISLIYFSGYDILEGKDLPGQFDYPCPESRSAVNCIRSVHSPQEAVDLCTADVKCRAFVIGHARTWTGNLFSK